MSIHPSLRTSRRATASLRNVLKRHERVRHLITQGTWVEGRSVLGLPKIKQMKMKARKASTAKEKTEASAEPSASSAAGSAASSAK